MTRAPVATIRELAEIARQTGVTIRLGNVVIEPPKKQDDRDPFALVEMKR